MSFRNLLLLTVLLNVTPAWGEGVMTPAAGSSSALPTGGDEGDCLLFVSGFWVPGACPGAGSGAPTDSTYLTQTADPTLSAEQALGALGTGCLGVTTTTGVVNSRTLTGTANQITVTNGTCGGNPTFSFPTNMTLPGTTTGTFSGNLTGNVTGAVTGNADTATALAANPSDCAANNFAATIAANGNLTCGQPSITAGVSGLGTGVGTVLATPTSANLASAITNETGTGVLVFGTAPTLTGATVTTSLNIPNSDTLPATCTVGDIYMDIDATTGQRIYACESTDTWALQGDGGEGGAGGAPTDATYWVGAADATLSAEINLGALDTGLVINTAGTPSIYAGVTCTNQVLRILSASGAGTCNTITSAFVDTTIWTGTVTSGLLKATSQGVLEQAVEGTDYISAETQTLDDAFNLGKVIDGANSLANAFRVGDGTTPWCIYTDASAGPQIRPCTDAHIKTTIPTDFTWALRNEEAGTDIETVDPDAASTLAMWTYGAAYRPKKSIYFPAGALSVDGTQCAQPTEATLASGPKTLTIICADNDGSTIYGSVRMPDSWDAGTVTFTHVYVQTAANTSALNGDIAAQCRGNGEAVSNTWGTEIAIDDAGVVGTNAVDQTTSAAVTPAGTCAAGDMLWFRYQLDATGTTTAVATLHHLGFNMEYSVTSRSD